MKLTPAQALALEMLHIDDRQTALCTRGEYVRGRTMAELVKRGLAFALPRSWDGPVLYRIKVDGEMALEEHRQRNVMVRLAERVERDMFAGML